MNCAFLNEFFADIHYKRKVNTQTVYNVRIVQRFPRIEQLLDFPLGIFFTDSPDHHDVLGLFPKGVDLRFQASEFIPHALHF